MNPSRYRLPQHCSLDRQRARRATIALERESYEFASDGGAGNPTPDFHLPPGVSGLPKAERFGPEKKVRLASHKLFAKLQAPFVRIAMSGSPMDTQLDYERVVGWMPRPREADTWQCDASFARQRLTGVNPKAIFRWSETPPDALAASSDEVLQEKHDTSLNAALDDGRLFGTDYSLLQDGRIQAQVRPGVTLAAPTSTFYVDEKNGELHPIAIQLRPDDAPEHPVCNVLDPRGDWLMARTHAQCADAHYHEAIYHLLDTHMVSEVFAVCTARNLHPDHPLRQLIGPHFEWNLAINDVARGNLLSDGGPIDVVLAAGVGGAMDLARAFWSDWSFEKRSFHGDLGHRGVAGKPLENYYYRDDASEIHAAIEAYATRIIKLWYSGDEDVADDYELQAWAKQIAQHIPNDFPASIETRARLIFIATEVIFRASAGHSAVNNGQYDAFAFVPNAPGSVAAGLPGTESYSEVDVLSALPGSQRCISAIGMTWTLSQPTHRSLLATGESPAFAQALNPEANAAVDALRARLRRLSATIGERNRHMTIPYTYLDPANVARSTGI
jgi:arachidonate 15-lipoxygenase